MPSMYSTPDGTWWRQCAGWNVPAHAAQESDFTPSAWRRGWKYCKNCDRGYRSSRKDQAPLAVPRRSRKVVLPSFDTIDFNSAEINESVTERDHEYVPNPELMQLWKTVTGLTLQAGAPPANLLFLGPSGSGKTDGAQYLAEKVNLPFTKVDAASMTDPESWFGQREIVVEEGVSVTRYTPSAFATAIQEPGVVFIDEVNRVDDEHRNVLLPILDGTRRVTNPLTGEIIERHPHCFVVMAGNRGLQFTGISNIDPAFMTRSMVVEFDYLKPDREAEIAVQATGVDEAVANVLARFAQETRMKSQADPDFSPISTREVIAAARLVAGGLSHDLAVKFVILNGTSGEGGSASMRSELEKIWAGVRPLLTTAPVSASPQTDWRCPTHGRVKHVPAGTSAATGKPYGAFNSCPEFGCDKTQDKNPEGFPGAAPAPMSGVVCNDCGRQNAPGVTTFCASCGGPLS